MASHYTNNGPIDCTVSPDLSNLKDKCIIITGGSSGLGAAYVEAFASAGAYITIADINENKRLTALPNVQYVHCDVTVWSDQLSVFKAAIKNSPSQRLDIVIANAGIAVPDPVFALESTDDPTEPSVSVININVIGVLYTTKLALHYFSKSPSSASQKCLILKSSLAGYLDIPSSPLYQSAKYAVRGLMCNLRGSGRCRVNVVAPWFIRTPILSDETQVRLGAMLETQGSEFAEVQDSVKAVLRIACDETVNGRSLGVVPRGQRKEGYVDLEHDDYKEGELLGNLQGILSNVNHRSAPAKE